MLLKVLENQKTTNYVFLFLAEQTSTPKEVLAAIVEKYANRVTPEVLATAKARLAYGE